MVRWRPISADQLRSMIAGTTPKEGSKTLRYLLGFRRGLSAHNGDERSQSEPVHAHHETRPRPRAAARRMGAGDVCRRWERRQPTARVRSRRAISLAPHRTLNQEVVKLLSSRPAADPVCRRHNLLPVHTERSATVATANFVDHPIDDLATFANRSGPSSPGRSSLRPSMRLRSRPGSTAELVSAFTMAPDLMATELNVPSICSTPTTRRRSSVRQSADLPGGEGPRLRHPHRAFERELVVCSARRHLYDMSAAGARSVTVFSRQTWPSQHRREAPARTAACTKTPARRRHPPSPASLRRAPLRYRPLRDAASLDQPRPGGPELKTVQRRSAG